MSKGLLSGRSVRRLNCRQRKKLRVGEFQELVFAVRMWFHLPMDDTDLDAFLGGFIELLESRHCAVGGMGGRLPLLETNGVVSAWGRGSPTEADKAAILDWLQQHPAVANAETGELVDRRYGCRE